MDWRNEIEEEISKDREKEILKESGTHILRKRKCNKKEKYKQEKLEIKEERKEEAKERIIKIAKRRVIVKESVNSDTGTEDVEKERNNTKREVKKKESGIKQRKGKIKETRIERKKLQESMKKWLSGGLAKFEAGSDIVKEVKIKKDQQERNEWVPKRKREKIKCGYKEVTVKGKVKKDEEAEKKKKTIVKY